MKRSLNIRQQKYKKNVISGMTKYNAAVAAGYSETTAKSRTKQLDQTVNIEDTMERMGLTDKKLVDYLIQLLTANKVIGYLHNYKKSDNVGLEKISPDEIVSNEFLDAPDNAIRAKALEIALKLKGKLRDKVDHKVDIKYTSMEKIVVEQKSMHLDLGEIPEKVKERINGNRDS